MSTLTVTQSKDRMTIGGAFGAVGRSWGKAIALGAIPLILAASYGQNEVTDVAPHSGPAACTPSTSNNFCAPTNDMDVAVSIRTLTDQGLVCSTDAVLTDSIVFQFKDDKSVKVVGFDEAMALAKDNKGWVQAFCK